MKTLMNKTYEMKNNILLINKRLRTKQIYNKITIHTTDCVFILQKKKN